MFLSAPLSSRNQFGKLLNQKGLVGEAVEIGTHRGDFAKILLDSWAGSVLHCVDPWSNYEQIQQNALPERGPSRADDLSQTLSVLRKHHPNRFRIVRNQSSQAANLFPDASLDFIYIDGDHSYPAVKTDLLLWWPKAKPGGIFAGHDFICPGEINGGWGQFIQKALREFLDQLAPTYHESHVQLIVEEGGLPWSWYIEKPTS